MKLFERIRVERPWGVFIGGDLLPSPLTALTRGKGTHTDFINGFLVRELEIIKESLGTAYPKIFVILGNDDGRMEEAAMRDVASRGLWEYSHNRKISFGEFFVYGYSYVPPTPFRLKDWERYDVSRYVDPGSLAPTEGVLSVPVPEYDLNYGTIAEDLEILTGNDKLDKAIFLFHAPPYKSNLDRAALDGQMIDYVPLDVHVGSIAIQRFIESRQPLITLHGHIHESTRLTGNWKDQVNNTFSINGAHDGPELSLIRFNPYKPFQMERELI